MATEPYVGIGQVMVQNSLHFIRTLIKKRLVMWTPSGYYDASPGAEELIGWQLNRGKDHAADYFPVSSFRERFYRPDVLTKVLTTQDETEALHQANEESGRLTLTTPIAQALPPVLEIVPPKSEKFFHAGKIKVRFVVRTSSNAPLNTLHASVNGLQLAKSLVLKRTSKNTYTQLVEVKIPAKDVEIQFTAENIFGISPPAILRLKWAGKTKVKPTQAKL
jgi:hypothetical protein